jgi:hypothetical protein
MALQPLRETKNAPLVRGALVQSMSRESEVNEFAEPST